MDNYVVYHLHSDLSNGVTNIDSITKFNQYIDYAASLGMKAMAFSEHGSIFQWLKKKKPTIEITTYEKYENSLGIMQQYMFYAAQHLKV